MWLATSTGTMGAMLSIYPERSILAIQLLAGRTRKNSMTHDCPRVNRGRLKKEHVMTLSTVRLSFSKQAVSSTYRTHNEYDDSKYSSNYRDSGVSGVGWKSLTTVLTDNS